VVLQGLSDHVHRGFVVQHTDLQNIGANVAEHRRNLLRQKRRRRGVNGLHA
jgi:hypothetical protein